MCSTTCGPTLRAAVQQLACGDMYLPPVLQGKPLIDGTLESIKHVMKGLDIATSNPRCVSCWGRDVI